MRTEKTESLKENWVLELEKTAQPIFGSPRYMNNERRWVKKEKGKWRKEESEKKECWKEGKMEEWREES